MTQHDEHAKPCPRCGQIIPGYIVVKRETRGSARTECADCTAAKKTKVTYGDMTCTPWQGEFDFDTMQPLDDHGRPYMPGMRKCGHADCVNSSHVLTWEKLEAERNDISYRTGVKLTHRQLVIALKRERRQTA